MAFVKRGKVDAAFVNIRREHLDAHSFGFVDVVDDLVGVAHFIRQQSRHKLDRPIGLHIRGLVCDEGVAGRMTFVEAIAGESFDKLENLLSLASGQTLINAARYKSFSFLGDGSGLFFAYRLDKPIGFTQRDVTEPVANAHHLFLVDHNAVRFTEDFGHNRMRQGPFRSVFSVDVIRD
ncbi:hypothetical protein ES703_66498 [subsurface metagenome]